MPAADLSSLGANAGSPQTPCNRHAGSPRFLFDFRGILGPPDFRGLVLEHLESAKLSSLLLGVDSARVALNGIGGIVSASPSLSLRSVCEGLI
jgi:hypothetical protein